MAETLYRGFEGVPTLFDSRIFSPAVHLPLPMAGLVFPGHLLAAATRIDPFQPVLTQLN
jgi:hypothetical protein